MDYSYEVCKRWGKVWLSENNQACALTINSNDKRSTIGLDLKLAINAIGLLRATKVLSREGKIKKNYPKEPFLYLWFIGVNPSNQGKGEGTKLLHTILEDADKKGLPVLLETSTEPNIPWYEKNGFKTYATIDFGYDLQMMRRDPR